MEQLSFFNLPSPCVGICKTDARGYCMGCFRNRDERFQWMNLSEQQKQNVVRLCQQRKRRRQYAHYKTKQQLLEQQAQQYPQFDFSEPNNDKPTDND